jgi:peroxiredoxin Q/BCP
MPTKRPELKPKDTAPAFSLSNQDDTKTSLKDFKGKWVVLYFYPKDNTSGCTLEAVDFTRASAGLAKMGAVVIGVSPDSIKSHCNFIDKHNLKIMLLSDPDHKVLEKYGVWKLKKLYGREYYGVERSTFLIDPEGKIAKVWRKVKVKDHVDEVKETLKELK